MLRGWLRTTLAARWLVGVGVALAFFMASVSSAQASCVTSPKPECKLDSPLLQGFLEARAPFVCRDTGPYFDADGIFPPSRPSDPIAWRIAGFARSHGDEAIPFYRAVIEGCPWDAGSAYQALAALGTPKAMETLKPYAYRDSLINLLLDIPGYATPANMGAEVG